MEYKTFRERLQESISNAVYRSEFPEPGGSWSPSRKYGQMNWEWKSWVFVLLWWSEMKRLSVILLVLEESVFECIQCGALWYADDIQFDVTLYCHMLQVFRLLQWCMGGLQSSGIWCLVSGWLVPDIGTQHEGLILQGQVMDKFTRCLTLQDEGTAPTWNVGHQSPGDVAPYLCITETSHTLFCFKRVLSYFHTSVSFLILYPLKWYIPVEDYWKNDIWNRLFVVILFFVIFPVSCFSWLLYSVLYNFLCIISCADTIIAECNILYKKQIKIIEPFS